MVAFNQNFASVAWKPRISQYLTGKLSINIKMIGNLYYSHGIDPFIGVGLLLLMQVKIHMYMTQA